MRNGILPNVVLRTIELTKRFGRHVAVDHLDLEVYEGDVFGFLGPNGAGKTTTMRMMVGLVKPTGGQIEINGCDVRRNFLDAIAQVGAMVDTPAFYLGLSGRKNLAISARMCGGVRRRRIREVLGTGKWFGLTVLPPAAQGGWWPTWGIMVLAPGAFITLGLLLGTANWLGERKKHAEKS